MEQRFTITSGSSGYLIQDQHGQLIETGHGLPATHKTALQYVRRRAEREHLRVMVYLPDGGEHLYDFSIPVQLGHHSFRKANVMALSDRSGRYNKLVCTYCGKVVRHYIRNNHYKEETEPCPMNPLL